jgi:eukaryotic-like serine/threonine-protein kinase
MTVLPDSAQALVGTVLHDTYRLERLIAEGGMGAVFEAGHLRLNRRFAIKVLSSSMLRAHPEATERFRREAEVIAAIGHPHIVEAVDFNQTPEGEPYMVMELLEGETLADRLQARGKLPLLDAAHVFMQAASALQAAHQQGIIHRDLKPENIFLCNRGRRDDVVKIFDFGIAKVIHALTQLTRVDMVVGTAVYMAPEQIRGDKDLDLRADVFAMGCILHEMLSGQIVFGGGTPIEIFRKVAHATPPALSSIRPDVSPLVDAVVSRALAKSRDERFSTMLEFWDALAGALRKSKVEVLETTAERQLLWGGSDDSADRTVVDGELEQGILPVDTEVGKTDRLEVVATDPYGASLSLPSPNTGPPELLPKRRPPEHLPRPRPPDLLARTGPPERTAPGEEGEDESATVAIPVLPRGPLKAEDTRAGEALRRRGWTILALLLGVALLFAASTALILRSCIAGDSEREVRPDGAVRTDGPRHTRVKWKPPPEVKK